MLHQTNIKHYCGKSVIIPMRNIEVDNASMAAAIVLGATSNGNDKWKKVDDKMTLGEYVNRLD